VPKLGISHSVLVLDTSSQLPFFGCYSCNCTILILTLLCYVSIRLHVRLLDMCVTV